MIYHILNDEKFTDWVINKFDLVNKGKNCFILVSNSKESKNIDDSRIEIFNTREFLKLVKPKEGDFFIFYFLHLHAIQFILKNKKVNYKKAWIGYGADYYYYLLRTPYFQSLYKPETLKLFKEYYQRNFLKTLLLKIYQKSFFNLKVKRAINHLNYFAPIIPNEFDLIKEEFSFENLKYLDFTFGDIEYLSLDSFSTELGDSILLNNSATFAGNHIDILEILIKINCNRKIIIPLSYGNDVFKEEIIHYTEGKLKDQVELLTEFMPRNSYFEKVKQCGFVIMGHLRQQAMGNIYGVLYMGAKLFLFKNNPVYEFLKSIGIIVFTIEELELNATLLNSHLVESDKLKNRQIIASYYSKEASLERIKKICQL